MPEENGLPIGPVGGPAGGAPQGILPSSQPPSGTGTEADRVAGLQRHYDSQLAALGYGSLNRVPAAREVQELTAAAQRAKELETQMSQNASATQQLASQMAATQQALQQQLFDNRKLMTLVKVNPALVPLAGAINVPMDADDAAITAAANAFLDNLKGLGFAPAGTSGAATSGQTLVPNPPILPAGTPPAGQLGTVDERIRQAQTAMWDLAGKDPKGYAAAEAQYFDLLKEKTRVDGWTDTQWGKPPGWDN